VWWLQLNVAAVSAVCVLFHEQSTRVMMSISSRGCHIKVDVIYRDARGKHHEIPLV
jgi:hypothetical protein